MKYIGDERTQTLLALLERAAALLQDYCAEVNGDMNDALAMEIERELLAHREDLK